MPETQSITGAYKIEVRDLRGNNIPIDRRAQALRPYSNGFCPQCREKVHYQSASPLVILSPKKLTRQCWFLQVLAIGLNYWFLLGISEKQKRG